MKKKIHVPNRVAIGNYSHAVQAGPFLYISGQIALDDTTGTLVDHDIEAESTQVMKNIEGILHAAGYQFSDVVKATIFLKEMDFYGKVNKIYGSYFPEDYYPAREAVVVKMLPKDANVEISLIAYKAL